MEKDRGENKKRMSGSSRINVEVRVLSKKDKRACVLVLVHTYELKLNLQEELLLDKYLVAL